MCGTWNAKWVGGDLLESYFMNILCTDWILNSSSEDIPTVVYFNRIFSKHYDYKHCD